MEILTALKARFSTRAFLDVSLSKDLLESILEIARFAPSGKNTQPWHVACVTGHTQKKISEALLKAFEAGEAPRSEYHYYPEPLPPAFKKRALACGAALYGALKVDHDDEAKRKEQWARNYQFFGAPACYFIFLDKGATAGSFLDTGLFMQNIMLAALEFKVASCPQAALAGYPRLIKAILGEAFADKLLVAGISVGYPDLTHPVNQYHIGRETVSDFTTWYD